MSNNTLIKNYKPRIVDKTIEKHLGIFGAICVKGPKWCGKTYTSSIHANSVFSLEQEHQRELGKTAINLIISGDTPHLIDEWQEIPAIWDYVKHEVDIRKTPGQFILTGSSTPRQNPPKHSGAGRIGNIYMHTMSLWESGNSSGALSLEDLCNHKFSYQSTGKVDLNDLIYYSIRGGWPALIDKDYDYIKASLSAYIDQTVSSINHNITRPIDKHKLRLFLRSLARNESTTVSINTLSSDVESSNHKPIDTDTVSRYLSLLDDLFLTENQPPFYPSIRSSIRVKQLNKRHFCDPSLVCSLLSLTDKKLLNDLNTFGFIFESLCERDLKIYAESFGASLYHYRDYLNNEIDAVIELPDGRWCAFEIKLGFNKVDDAARSLLKIKKQLEENNVTPPDVLCVICGMSEYAYQRDDGVYVVPITALKN